MPCLPPLHFLHHLHCRCSVLRRLIVGLPALVDSDGRPAHGCPPGGNSTVLVKSKGVVKRAVEQGAAAWLQGRAGRGRVSAGLEGGEHQRIACAAAAADDDDDGDDEGIDLEFPPGLVLSSLLVIWDVLHPAGDLTLPPEVPGAPAAGRASAGQRAAA
eukprot:1161670-Pelagomonas_calceolata.AAC.20